MKGHSSGLQYSPKDLCTSPPSDLDIWGNPKSTFEGLEFDGITDGLLLSETLLPGALKFTIEVQLKPRGDGNFEQRFFHIQDEASTDRLLLELRLRPQGVWYADTCFQSKGKCIILQTTEVLIPADTWSTYRVVYDGTVLSNWINGHLVESAPFAGGHLPVSSQTSIGIRANRTYPFRGTLGPITLLPFPDSPESHTVNYFKQPE